MINVLDKSCRETQNTHFMCVRARAHARTHRSISNNYCFSTAKIIRDSASALVYTYTVCLDFELSLWNKYLVLWFLRGKRGKFADDV
jgi:hypothetical protein